MSEDACSLSKPLQSPQENPPICKRNGDNGISFNKHSGFKITAHNNSDWGGCPSTSRSTGGLATYLGSKLISWSSKRQFTISKSSTEAEYRSLSETTSELTWLCQILKELGIPLPATPLLLCDNLSVVIVETR